MKQALKKEKNAPALEPGPSNNRNAPWLLFDKLENNMAEKYTYMSVLKRYIQTGVKYYL